MNDSLGGFIVSSGGAGGLSMPFPGCRKDETLKVDFPFEMYKVTQQLQAIAKDDIT